MHTTNLRRVGGSVMMAVPPAILDLLHLEAGATVGISVADGRLIVEPQQRPRYTMEELLALCTDATEMTEEEQDWIAAPAVGGELL